MMAYMAPGLFFPLTAENWSSPSYLMYIDPSKGWLLAAKLWLLLPAILPLDMVTAITEGEDRAISDSKFVN